MDKFLWNVTVCYACKIAPNDERKYCRECNGVGYFEEFHPPENCTTSLPECPVSYDPGVHGWECSKCGRSGPCDGEVVETNDRRFGMW